MILHINVYKLHLYEIESIGLSNQNKRVQAKNGDQDYSRWVLLHHTINKKMLQRDTTKIHVFKINRTTTWLERIASPLMNPLPYFYGSQIHQKGQENMNKIIFIVATAPPTSQNFPILFPHCHGWGMSLISLPFCMLCFLLAYRYIVPLKITHVHTVM